MMGVWWILESGSNTCSYTSSASTVYKTNQPRSPTTHLRARNQSKAKQRNPEAQAKQSANIYIYIHTSRDKPSASHFPDDASHSINPTGTYTSLPPRCRESEDNPAQPKQSKVQQHIPCAQPKQSNANVCSLYRRSSVVSTKTSLVSDPAPYWRQFPLICTYIWILKITWTRCTKLVDWYDRTTATEWSGVRVSLMDFFLMDFFLNDSK